MAARSCHQSPTTFTNSASSSKSIASCAASFRFQASTKACGMCLGDSRVMFIAITFVLVHKTSYESPLLPSTSLPTALTGCHHTRPVARVEATPPAGYPYRSSAIQCIRQIGRLIARPDCIRCAYPEASHPGYRMAFQDSESSLLVTLQLDVRNPAVSNRASFISLSYLLRSRGLFIPRLL